jgi:preprotein translocase subunit SecB
MQTEGSVLIKAQYIKDLSFENPNVPGIFNIDAEPNTNLSIDVNANKLDDKTFEVTLNIYLKSMVKEETLFILECDYAGIFEAKAATEKELEKILMVHCPNILFPYLRRIISDTTRDGGFMPLMIHPIDFLGLYAQKKNTEIQ